MTAPPPTARELEGRLDARRLGQLANALIAFGAFGLLALALATVVGVRSFVSIAPLNESLESERQQAVTMLHDTSIAVADAGKGVTNAGTSLTEAQSSAQQAATMARSVAKTMRGVSAASQAVSILGAKPLGQLGAGFADAAAQTEKMADSLEAVAGALGSNGTDIATVRSDLDRVAAELDRLSATVDAMPPLADPLAGARPLAFVFAVLLLWLTVPAAASLAAGIWLRRWLSTRTGAGALKPETD